MIFIDVPPQVRRRGTIVDLAQRCLSRNLGEVRQVMSSATLLPD